MAAAFPRYVQRELAVPPDLDWLPRPPAHRLRVGGWIFQHRLTRYRRGLGTRRSPLPEHRQRAVLIHGASVLAITANQSSTCTSPTGQTTPGSATCERLLTWQPRSVTQLTLGHPTSSSLPRAGAPSSVDFPKHRFVWPWCPAVLPTGRRSRSPMATWVNAVQAAQNGAFITVAHPVVPEGDSSALAICRLLEQRGILLPTSENSDLRSYGEY